MSEFTCENDHLVTPSETVKGRCPECGGKIIRMDGKTSRELAWEEEEWDKEVLLLQEEE